MASADARLGDALADVEALVEAGRHRDAWRALCRALALDSTTATCERVARALSRLDAREAGLADLGVALLTDFTAEPMVPVLVAQGARSGIRIRPYVPGFDTWAQEIVDPASGLRHHQPDVVILALRLETLCPPLTDAFLSLSAGEVERLIEETAGRVESALGALRAWSAARILVQTFARPVHPALGFLDATLPAGQTAAVRMLNERLVRAVGDAGDAFVIDADVVRARVGDRAWHDPRLWALARLPYGPAALQALVQEYLRVLQALTGRSRKVLVLDGDDTLWGGVLGEVGPEGIALGEGYPGSAFLDVQRAVLEWHRRGVVICLNSKNDESEVTRLLDTHPAMLLRPAHVAAARINWQDKAVNMTELAAELGLALDSFVFVDDSRVECDRMRSALPEVLTLLLDGEPAMRAAAIRALAVFDSLSYGADDRARGAHYRLEADRRKLQQELPSLDDFYRSLEMALTIEPLAADNVARAAELTQRTNQFNLNPRRFTAAELTAAAREQEAFVFRLRDRFGDYGIIGLALLCVDGSEATITQLLLSCRVLKRTVEESVLAFLVERGRARGASRVSARCTPTAKNHPVRDFIAAQGFEPEATAGGDAIVRHRLPAGVAVAFSPWVSIAGATPVPSR